MSQKYPSSQTADQALEQIDALGLNWFYHRALELAQNRTSNLPSVDNINIELTFADGVGNYQGLTMLLTGFHETVLANSTSVSGQGVIIADFQPDGTLIYMSQPQTRTS